MIQGSITELIPATLAERREVYDWCFNSDTTKYHAGENYPNNEIPTFEEFCEDYEDYYFEDTGKNRGKGFIITHENKKIGFINYACYHLKPHKAELDIWLNSESNLGKGYGTDAIVSLCNYLASELGIQELIMRPSGKNTSATKSYSKAGFEKTDVLPSYYLLDEYIEAYGDGDYGAEETVTMIKRV